MKRIILLSGFAALFLTSGCAEHEHHHHGYGGAHEGYYENYGYDRDRDLDRHHEEWEHR